jgi:hypothetical protein
MNDESPDVSFTPIDVRCRQRDCHCTRSVHGTIIKEGYAVAPEAGSYCPTCQHPWSDHEILVYTQAAFSEIDRWASCEHS